MQNHPTKNALLDMDKWREIIESWNKSGESQKNYCQRIGISTHLLTHELNYPGRKKKTRILLLSLSKYFEGFLHCDGYIAYDSIASKNPGLTLVGCLYHARRKFVEVAKIAPNKEGVATRVIN